MNEFGHKVPTRDAAGEITGLREKPVRRVTRNELGHNHGPDKHRKLVVSLLDGDLIEFRPAGTRRSKTMSAHDLYMHCLRTEAWAVKMEKLREIKEKKSIRLAQQRQQRAEKRLTKGVKQ